MVRGEGDMGGGVLKLVNGVLMVRLVLAEPAPRKRNVKCVKC